MAGDPSQNVHQDLLPHVHLVSTFRYASMHRVELQDVTKWLMQAPKIARDTAPFYWTYLETPPDGTIHLTWQPTARRNVEFASDGYVWASPEVVLSHPVGNGVALEIYVMKCGYRIGEPFTMHSRRRFRLTQTQPPASNVPQVDPNLWIVHYGPSDKNDRFPAGQVTVPHNMQVTLNNRTQILQLGQILRKEFMLSDRVNWPQIPFPQRGQSMYNPPMLQRPIPAQVAYGGPAAKRQRGGQQAPPPQQMGAAPGYPADDVIEDEEDIHRGDMFDHLSPRQIAVYRYQQNHEWIEEILASPYRIGQIEVSDLGLGRKGELAALTDGIFEAQGVDVLDGPPKKPYIGRLDPDLAEEFRKRVYEKQETVKAEIEKLKAKHADDMARFMGNAAIKHAEKELHSTTGGVGDEPWRLEERVDGEDHDAGRDQTQSIDDVIARVEELVGKRAVAVQDVQRVQDGGYQEAAPEPEVIPQPTQGGPGSVGSAQAAGLSRQPSQQSGVMAGDSDIDMGGTVAGMLDDQMHTGFSSTSTPLNNFPTPQTHLSTMPSAAGTPANFGIPSPHPGPAPTSQPPAPIQEDVSMEDADSPKPVNTASDQGTGSGEWVVVPKGGVSPSSAPVATQPPAEASGVSNTPDAGIAKPESAAPTPGDGLGFEGDNNDFSSLGDLDTAGDALASYDPPSVDLEMDVEDSAFGEAFHGIDHSGNDDS
ncbi:SWI/SNF and RSC complexes subunit ssr4 [Cladorrhinum sp. PSN259]|nr:SWI/SNF and RSC complexes subunit ssr4 [Cladorrhinum sp. PSN259]